MSILTILAEAKKLNPGDIGYQGVTNSSAPFEGVLNTVYAWAAILAVVVIVIAGYLYTTSSGNPAQTKRARDAIIAAAAGLVIVASAFVITQFVIFRATS